jgi:hypothetical protein
MLSSHCRCGIKMTQNSLLNKSDVQNPINSDLTLKKNKNNFTLERVADISQMLASKVDSAIHEIERLNGQTQMIAINARIEASRAGIAGKTFSIIAEQMNDLSNKIGTVNKKMRVESRDAMDDLENLIRIQATHVRGTRLSDLALTNIDLIDRNLYERSVNVLWWATDDSVVNALTRKTIGGYDLVSKRFSIILNSYTVYFDLILCDMEGNVVANGRPENARTVGTNVKESKWFETALRTKNGKEFGFQTVGKNVLVQNESSLVFSCTVREGGYQYGKIIGVLGAFFKWEGLAQNIVKQVHLDGEEKNRTRICIVDDTGLVLADSKDLILEEKIDFLGINELFQQKKGFMITEYQNDTYCIAHALSPGYEGYSSGWHSIILQKMNISY